MERRNEVYRQRCSTAASGEHTERLSVQPRQKQGSAAHPGRKGVVPSRGRAQQSVYAGRFFQVCVFLQANCLVFPHLTLTWDPPPGCARIPRPRWVSMKASGRSCLLGLAYSLTLTHEEPFSAHVQCLPCPEGGREAPSPALTWVSTPFLAVTASPPVRVCRRRRCRSPLFPATCCRANREAGVSASFN